MHTKIKVLSDVDLSVNEINSVLTEFDTLFVLSQEIRELLDDTNKWCGNSHDTCSQIHDLIDRYASSIQPLYEQLKTDLNELTILVDGFASQSYLTSGIRSW